MQAALLLLPDKFTLDQFYAEIVSLSYRGDFRLLFGEDRAKIRKIAEGSRAELEQIYLPLLKTSNDVSVQYSNVEQDTRSAAMYDRIVQLPVNILRNLQHQFNSRSGMQNDVEEIAGWLSQQVHGSKHISDIIEDIVRRSAWQQTVKNAFSAGATRSLAYSFAKLVKMLKSL
ncbi:unnamed protein product [Gongylonema pulchrum]|uniref:Phosphatidate cytidylyltransferase, mitochondrial n=1 Tax=Gongylonema pulchrum TaxID=637853 RepID=A0A3P7MIU5_9BILA|nr:unnamed protein product [Gongylonema pulchrum]